MAGVEDELIPTIVHAFDKQVKENHGNFGILSLSSERNVLVKTGFDHPKLPSGQCIASELQRISGCARKRSPKTHSKLDYPKHNQVFIVGRHPFDIEGARVHNHPRICVRQGYAKPDPSSLRKAGANLRSLCQPTTSKVIPACSRSAVMRVSPSAVAGVQNPPPTTVRGCSRRQIAASPSILAVEP
jgi:hypothetical protein